MVRPCLTLLVLTLILYSCGPDKKQAESEEAVIAPVTEQVLEEEKNGPREPTDDELRETGVFKTIEDSGYPMFSIDVEFPRREMTQSFSLNIEAISLNMEQLEALKEQYASFYYLTEEEATVYDIHSQGKSIMGEDAIGAEDADKQITGLLSGAEAATGGDLPDVFKVTASNGHSISFEEFITEEMAAVNNTEITIYYRMSFRNKITYVSPPEEDDQ